MPLSILHRYSYFDLWKAAGNYLVSPDGRYRVIDGLEFVAWDIIRAGVRVRWGIVPNDKAACAYWWRKDVVLAPWLWDAEPMAILYCLTHELGHCVMRRSCDHCICSWQMGRYQSMFTPPAWAA